MTSGFLFGGGYAPPTGGGGGPSLGQWHSLVGGGGYVTGLSFSADGVTMLARTDSGGAYIYNHTTSQWDMLPTTTRLGKTAVGCFPHGGGGAYDIQVCLNDHSHVYMVWGVTVAAPWLSTSLIWHSSDGGATFTQTDISQFQYWNDANQGRRGYGPKGQVDPNNGSIYFLVTIQNGLFKTLDGGVTVTNVSAVPANASGGDGGFVAFDPTSSTTGGYTHGIYCGVYGSGVYHSTDGGSTWAILPGTGPTLPAVGGVNPADGILWVAELEWDQWNSNIWNYVPGTGWTNFGNPGAPTQCLTFNGAGNVWAVLQAGDMWYFSGNAHANSTPNPTISAGDTPWLLSRTNPADAYLTTSNMLANPNVPGEFWMGSGLGVWKTNNLKTDGTVTNWTAFSKGIENLSTSWISHPYSPSSPAPVLVTSQDIGLIPIPTPGTLPTFSRPDAAVDPSLNQGISVDWVPGSPNDIVFIINKGNNWNGSSPDYGTTITPFPGNSSPPAPGGWITACDVSNILYVAANNGQLTLSTDAGTTFPRADLSAWGVMYSNSMTAAANVPQGQGAVTANSGTTTSSPTLNVTTPAWLSARITAGDNVTVYDSTTSQNIGTCASSTSSTVVLHANALNPVTTGDSLQFTATTGLSISVPITTSIPSQMTTLLTTFNYGGVMMLADVQTGFNNFGTIASASGTTITLTAGSTLPVTSGDGLWSWTVNNGTPLAWYDRMYLGCSDYVLPHTMYVYNYGNNDMASAGRGAAGAGVYMWQGPAPGTWTQKLAGFIHGNQWATVNPQMKTVPMLGSVNTAGHLFYFPVSGNGGGAWMGSPDPNMDFVRSTDGGHTWTQVSGGGGSDGTGNVQGVTAFGFGACKPGGGGYPAVYIAGWVNQGSGLQYGIWRSDDDCVTWNFISDCPMGDWIQGATAMDGDKNTWNKFYVAIAGAGYCYYG